MYYCQNSSFIFGCIILMLAHKHRLLVPSEAAILLHKETPTGFSLYADLVFLTDQFREFQITVVEEALAQIQELLHDDGSLLFEDAVNQAEYILQDTNAKLLSFAEKMTTVPYFDIRGMITIAQHNAFVSAVIGDVTIVLGRKGRVAYTMQNDSDTRQKISLFSDVIEGDIVRDDVLYFFGTHLASSFDRDDMDSLLQRIDGMDYDTMLEQWEKTLITRVPAEDVYLLGQYYLDRTTAARFSPAVLLRWKKIAIPAPVANMATVASDKVKTVFHKTSTRFGAKVKNKEFALLAALVGMFLLFVVRGVIASWIKNTTTNTIQSDGSVTASLSIDDIKKEIAEFQKLDAESDEKGIKYNALVQELDRIKQEWKRVNDVDQLKKILDTEYLQWFNIIMLDSLIDQMVYDISSLEKSTIGTPIQLFFRKGLYIAGTQWWVLGWISSEIRGTAVRSIVNNNFKTCSLNLLKNGLYCATDKNAIYHVTKWWVEAIWGNTVVFPGSIIGLDTYGSSNMYVLTDDPTFTKEKTYLLRYTNSLGSQTAFATSMPLPMWPSAVEWSYSNWFSSVAIDGSFLMWSKSEKTLYQFYRAQQDKTLTARAVPMKWWTTIWQWFSDDVKVMTTSSTRYVYLYDRANKTLSVYTSNPAKNGDAYTTAYALNYVMRLDLSNVQASIVDLVIDDSDGKQTAYVLLPDGVAKVSLSDFLESLKKIQAAKNAG